VEDERTERERRGPSGDGAGSPGYAGVLKVLGVPGSHGRAVALHTGAWFLFGVFAAGVTQQLGFVVGKQGGSPALVALVMTGPYAASALAMLYVPWLERHRSRHLVAVPKMFAAAMLMLAAVCTGPVGLAIVAVAALTVHSAGNVFYGRLLGQLYPLESRGRMQSLPMFVQAAAMAGMSVVAGKALGSSEEAYRWFLPACSAVGIAAGAMVLMLPTGEEKGPPARSSLRECLRDVTGDKSFLLWIAIYSCTSIGFWLASAARPVYFEKMLGFGYWENGLAIAAANGTYCFAFLAWGRLLDRMRSLLTMVASWALIGAGLVLMTWGRSFEWVIAGQGLFGIGLAGNDIAWFPVVLEFAPEGRVDRYMGFYMTIFGLRVLVGGVVSGTLMQLDVTGSWKALVLASATILLGAAGMFALRRLMPADK